MRGHGAGSLGDGLIVLNWRNPHASAGLVEEVLNAEVVDEEVAAAGEGEPGGSRPGVQRVSVKRPQTPDSRKARSPARVSAASARFTYQQAEIPNPSRSASTHLPRCRSRPVRASRITSPRFRYEKKWPTRLSPAERVPMPTTGGCVRSPVSDHPVRYGPAREGDRHAVEQPPQAAKA